MRDNTIGYMLSGKAVSRAVRGHMFTDAALNALLIAEILHVDIENKERMDNLVCETDPSQNASGSTSSGCSEYSDGEDFQRLSDLCCLSLSLLLAFKILIC